MPFDAADSASKASFFAATFPLQGDADTNNLYAIARTSPTFEQEVCLLSLDEYFDFYAKICHLS
jgi:hypothetical protein